MESFSASDLRSPQDIVNDLLRYEILLKKWQKVQNLVSRETLNDLWYRHFLDSLQLIEHLTEQDRSLVDLGSGGGLPAIPVVIALKSRSIDYNLVESNKRKVSFLKTVGRELDLPIQVQSERIENLDPHIIPQIDIITSRATAPLIRLFELSYPLLSKTTRFLLHKGVDYRKELDESRANWRFDVVYNASKTSDVGVILDIKNLEKRF